MARRILSYLYYIILSKLGPRDIRKLIWRTRKIRLIVSNRGKGHGVLNVPSVLCFTKGLLPNQLVRVSFNHKDRYGQSNLTERILKLEIDNRLSSDEVSLSRTDAFNVFGHQPIYDVKVQDIVPTSALRIEKLSVAENIKLARIQQSETKPPTLEFNQLRQLLSKQSILHNHDVICIRNTNRQNSQQMPQFYRVDCDPSPCLVDQTTSVYETAEVNGFCPFGGFTSPFYLHPSLKDIVDRLTSIYNAYKEKNETVLQLFLTGAAGNGKRLAAKLFAASTHRSFVEGDAYDVCADVISQTEAKIKNLFEKAEKTQPCVLYVGNANVLGYDSTSGVDQRVLNFFCEQAEERPQITVVLSCDSDMLKQTPESVKSIGLYTLAIPHMDEEDRFLWVRQFIPENLAHFVVQKTSGFSLSEMLELVKNIKYKQTKSKKDAPEQEFAEWAIDQRNANFADAIGAPKIPNVFWDDVGGLEEAKQTVVESIQANMYGSQGLKRSGIILHGAPGCGKTLIAKAVATEFKVAFLSVKGPELLNKYVGQSEENLRKVFERARQASPCIIFFDEIDSLAPNRGKNGDSGGVIDRIVSQLLSELDKLHNSSKTKVFVMGATNRPDLLDSSLLTPGRFDKLVEITPGRDFSTRTKILEAVARKVRLHEDVDLTEIAKACDEEMSGAQLSALVSNAAMRAIIERVQQIESGQLQSKTGELRLTQKHLLRSLHEMTEKSIKSI
ncbi:unnamed protein product [Caenorhabditis auriculariae]|uniref:Peroxisomal ATPase PEX1 n=1 Tax=Caenorhabditis auriculariae TaxID=2777116 RepID=A0A8S1GV46_9PELO|nr:unnamed protein product [Caenorhabditis auriculariae]